MGITISLLITFTFHNVLNSKRATNSVFQHLFADTIHNGCLFVFCSTNERGRYLYKY